MLIYVHYIDSIEICLTVRCDKILNYGVGCNWFKWHRHRTRWEAHTTKRGKSVYIYATPAVIAWLIAMCV